MNYDIVEATSFEEVLSEIEENSKYKRLPPKEKTWMTVPEMIYKWIDDGKFSSVKIGYISRVKRDEFEAWLKERERKGN